MRQVPNSKRKQTILCIACCFYLLLAISAKAQPIRTLVLHGSYSDMGRQYGKSMSSVLHHSWAILWDFYHRQQHIPSNKLQAQSDALYDRFPINYQMFIDAEAQAAGLSLAQAKLLNAMETLGELLPKEKGACAFIHLPRIKTRQYASLIGRNYDFPAPYDRIADDLTVTVLKTPDTIATAFISLPGEIYCPSCVNANGLFMALNNGMPSGGHHVDKQRQSLLINLLQVMQLSANLSQMDKQLRALQSDYSLIINTADKQKTHSYEFSSTLGLKVITNNFNKSVFVSTNYFLNPKWKTIPIPTDTSTWMGVTRLQNLQSLAKAQKKFTLKQFMHIMNKTVAQGGAVVKHTIYQLIYDTGTNSLFVKINHQSSHWQKINLSKLFK